MTPSPAPTLRQVLLALAAYGVLLTAVVCALDAARFTMVFREGGAIESLTIPLWIALAAWCLDPIRPWRRGTVACGLLALACAMREADWQHHEATNMSMFKFKFYLQPGVADAEKWLAGLVSLLVLATIVWALGLSLRHALRERRRLLSADWARVMAVGFALLVGVKLLDRLINALADFSGYRIGGLTGRLIGGWEEGFELVLPLVFAAALWRYRVEARAGAG